MTKTAMAVNCAHPIKDYIKLSKAYDEALKATEDTVRASRSALMVDNLDDARLNRERVKNGYCNEFYDEQARCLAQWTESKPPENLVLGELPVVGTKQIRLDRD